MTSESVGVHYRVTLGRKTPTGSYELLGEVHQDAPRMRKGWQHALRESPWNRVSIGICMTPSETCPKYLAWRAEKDEAEDEAEAAEISGRRLLEAEGREDRD